MYRPELERRPSKRGILCFLSHHQGEHVAFGGTQVLCQYEGGLCPRTLPRRHVCLPVFSGRAERQPERCCALHGGAKVTHHGLIGRLKSIAGGRAQPQKIRWVEAGEGRLPVWTSTPLAA